LFRDNGCSLCMLFQADCLFIVKLITCNKYCNKVTACIGFALLDFSEWR
jgi:hypothetical protein